MKSNLSIMQKQANKLDRTICLMGGVLLSCTVHSAATLEEIVITAEKRESSLQDASLAVTALTTSKLKNLGVSEVSDLSAAVPSLEVGQMFGSVNVTIRGVGVSNATNLQEDPTVPVHVDGVYMSRPAAATALFQDLERLEVLRGPQGTLYGRNATGGAINVISKRPTQEFEGELEGTIGNYDARNLQGVVNTPVTDNVAIRVAGIWNKHDGYEDNNVAGVDPGDSADEWGLKASLFWNAADNFDALLRWTHYEFDDVGITRSSQDTSFLGTPILPAAQRVLPPPLNEPREVFRDTEPSQEIELDSVSLELDWEINDSWSMKSITAVSTFEMAVLRDQNDIPLSNPGSFPEAGGFLTMDTTWWSEELNFTYDNGGAFRFQGGVFYFEEDGDRGFEVLRPNPIGEFPPEAHFFQDATIDSMAIFGQGELELTDNLSLVAGIRYTEDEKEGDQVTTVTTSLSGAPIRPAIVHDGEGDFDSTDYKVGLDWKINEDILLYAHFSTAFKSGGFNYTDIAELKNYEPEEIEAFEIGIKMDFLDHRGRLNVSAFTYDFENLQIAQVLGAGIIIQNIDEADIRGIESELEFAVTEQFTVSTQLSYLDTEYGDALLKEPISGVSGRPDLVQTIDVQVGGNQLNLSPKFSGSLGLNYVLPLGDLGSLNGNVNLYYQEEAWVRPQQLLNDKVDDYTRTDITLTWTSAEENWYITAFVNNLEDEDVLEAKDVSFDASHNVHFKAPRTYGLTIGYRN